MKKITMILISVVVFYGCKKSSNDNQPQATVVGKWTKTKTIYQESVTGQPTQTTDDSNSDPNNYIQFNSNGSGTISSGSSGTYDVNNFTYSISQQLITATSNGNTEVDTIKNLTNSNLVIRTGVHSENGGKFYDEIIDDYYSK